MSIRLLDMTTTVGTPAKKDGLGSDYEFFPERVVFDEHDEKAGGKVVRSFKKQDLERIVRKCNALAAQGDLCPLTIGHTIPGETVKETDQPEIVGYAKDFKVCYHRVKKKHVIVSNWYIKKDRVAEARKYPRVSVELWPAEDRFDPIALLRRTPELELGQWTYGKNRAGKQVIRYAMEMCNMPEEPVDGEHKALMQDEEHAKKVHHFMKHVFTHPHVQHFMKHYGKADGAGPDPTATPDAAAPSPTDISEAELAGEIEGELEEKEAEKHAAMLSGTNGAVPEQHGKKTPKPDNKKGTTTPSQDAELIRYRKLEADRYAKLEAEMKTLREDNLKVKEQERYAKARQKVTQLVAEGYQLNADKEVLRFSKMTDEQMTEWESEIRVNYRQDPSGVPMLPVLQTEVDLPEMVDTSVKRYSKELVNRAAAYAPAHGISFDEAVELLSKKK